MGARTARCGMFWMPNAIYSAPSPRQASVLRSPIFRKCDFSSVNSVKAKKTTMVYWKVMKIQIGTVLICEYGKARRSPSPLVCCSEQMLMIETNFDWMMCWPAFLYIVCVCVCVCWLVWPLLGEESLRMLPWKQHDRFIGFFSIHCNAEETQSSGKPPSKKWGSVAI